MADLRIIDAPEIPTNNITGQEKIPTGGSGNYSITLDSVANYTKTKKDLADNTAVDGKVNGVRQELDAHIEDLLNPHQVTKGQIGLGNVDNTADADKPVSNSTQAAIISAVSPKADKTYVDNQLALKANKVDVYTKENTYTKQESSDLVSSSISTALTPVNSSLDLAKRGVINRYDSSLTYNSGERVVLANGDIVKSTINGNTNNPNVDMSGWINNNSAYFYHTVSAMVADVSLTNGKTVATKGYHSSFDGGGAIYLISTTPTSYSIPLSNGLHAVFSDVFDIRKFGLQDDPTFTIDQTEEIRRMINYADSRIYEIDFHGFRIKTPEIVSHTSSRGVTFRGMPFHKVHTLKNLELRHNRGADLILEGLVGIGFYPKSASDVSGLFRLSNVKFDLALQNYSTANGEADGAFIGFHAEAHPDWGYSMWNMINPQEFQIDFDFQDIDFKSPAMSYNMSLSAWKSRKVTCNNMVGEYLALYIFSCAKKVVCRSIDAIYRKDLHTQGRELVRSVVHIEPETGPDGSVKFDLIDIENVKVRDSDGNVGLGFFSYVNGKLEIKELNLKNIDGYTEVYVNYAKGGYVNNLTLDNTKEYTLNGTFDAINVKDSITKVYSKSNVGNNGVLTSYPLGNIAVTNLNFKGGAIVGKLTDGSAYTVVRNMSIDGTPISTQEYLLDTPEIGTYRVIAKSVDFKDSSKFIRSKFGRIDLQGVSLNTGYHISDFISRGDNGGLVVAQDCMLTPQSGNLVSANGISVVFNNTTSFKPLESLVPSSPYVEYRLSSFAAIQVPSGSTGSIANDATFTVSASAQYCHVGDTFDVSTNLPMAGCLVFAKCETNGTITVRVKNFSGGSVGLGGVVFNVHRLTIN